jgi:CBS domain-containing protein
MAEDQKRRPLGGDRPLSAEADSRWRTPLDLEPRGIIVEEVMAADVFTVSPGRPAAEAARIMRDNKVGFLPVVESDGEVVGVVTDRDLVVRLLADDRSPETAVEEVMTAAVVVCRAADDLAVCEHLMRVNQIARLVVLGDDEQLAGVISFSDLAQYEEESRVGAVIADVTEREAEPH